jgi:hypothetical protein
VIVSFIERVVIRVMDVPALVMCLAVIFGAAPLRAVVLRDYMLVSESMLLDDVFDLVVAAWLALAAGCPAVLRRPLRQVFRLLAVVLVVRLDELAIPPEFPVV